MNLSCPVDAALEACQKAEFRRVDRLTRNSSSNKLTPWERFHSRRDPFYLQSAWCNGRFHFYEASMDGERFERVTTDCPNWKAESRRAEGETGGVSRGTI